jgi:hypothetical protein
VSKRLNYSDAVRLLGGQDSKIVSALDKFAGGVLLSGAAIGLPGMLTLLGVKSEVVRLSQELVRKLSERRGGLSRYSRTQRLEAAHAVLVVTAYLDALEKAELPDWFADLALTKAERTAMADEGSQLARDATHLINVLFSTPVGLPGLHLPYEDYLSELREGIYAVFSNCLLDFVERLAIWEQLTVSDDEQLKHALRDVADLACYKYEELFRRLVVDFPEVACWANLRDHQATRAEVRSVGMALAALERRLTEIATGSVPDARRSSLTRAYRAELERPIVESGDVPAGLRIPTLRQAYVTPRFRLRQVDGAARLSEESWWEKVPVRDDLDDFLIGYLTSPRASEAPLLVLGQPGSGKSILTRMLAARLPASDFLPVRVALREVPAAADLQDQIEHAICKATGERLDWPALVRSAGDALPVVSLDGFDELLQATGVSQTDYLAKVATFQCREKEQGRPVAVIVTSRTSVADRARAPEDMLALRLEPFDPDRVMTWLNTWNATNAGHFAARGLAPLSSEVVLAHPDLAAQPLLLLMLALYDADGNALQRVEIDLPQVELYERLLRSFARREVVKHRPGLPDRDLNRAVEEELRRLSVAAFAMFNRGSQWVSESDLDADLLALPLFGAPATTAAGSDLRAPLRAAEIVIGRFFFIHRAQASRDDTQLETYEFLHATFGEFLVARLIWQVLVDIAAREAASTMSLGAAPVDDDLLHALLSFAALTVRTAVVGFLTEMVTGVDQPKRESLAGLLVRLFRIVHQPRPARGYLSYEPQLLAVPARHAAYSANLVLLAVCVAGSVKASELYGRKANVVTSWHSQSLLWRSQLNTEEWTSLVETFALSRLWDGECRDILLTLDDGTFQTPCVDPFWTYDEPPTDVDRSEMAFWKVDHSAGSLRRKAHFQCGMMDDIAMHALEPLVSTLGHTINMFVAWKDTCPSAAHTLLDVWLLPLRDATAEERRASYTRCARTVTFHKMLPGSDIFRNRYAAVLLDRLTTDEEAPAALATDVLNMLVTCSTAKSLGDLGPCLIRFALAFLGRDRDSDQRIATVLQIILPQVDPANILTLECWVRLTELGLSVPPLVRLDTLQQIANRRPDLVERIRRITPPEDAHGT